MADRGLSFNDLQKVFESHGCEFSFNRKTQYIKITRGAGSEHRCWRQHSHKGRKDSFSKNIVAAGRRKLGLSDMPDKDFYANL